MADTNETFDLEQILSEVTGEPSAKPQENAASKTAFQLDLNLDDEYGEIPEPVAEPASVTKEPEEPIHMPKAKKQREGKGCLKSVVYAILVLAVSGILAYFLVMGGLDFTGMTRDDSIVDITVPKGSSTQAIAEVLEQEGLIDQPLVFRVYCKLTKADGKWQPGTFSVQKNMGYKLLVEELQTAQSRETVEVLIPEGYTIDKIATRLEDKKVCSAAEFYRALREVDYSADYSFIADFTKLDKDDYDARIYKLEGYLFPDTYQFYLGCSGETVVRKMLDTFNLRLDTTLRAAANNKGLTTDELIVLASIVQGEAANKQDMEKVARVLQNRLENAAEYPKLQCDSTRDYIQDMVAANSNLSVANENYDTYTREGLPVGSINNPGLNAIKAVLYPSEDETVKKCYFFATDYDTGITYFSQTYNEHVRICTKYGIGMYG